MQIKVLCTGDFRYHSDLHDGLGAYEIDTLYLDNTYLYPHCVFPTKEESMNIIIGKIKQKNPSRVYVALDNLGKEGILFRIAHEFQCKIGVSPQRQKVMELCDLPRMDIFTTEKSSTWISVCSKFETKKYENENGVMVILPTALLVLQKVKNHSDNVCVVPYSDHSSYDELVSFVKLLKPVRVNYIVKQISGGENVLTNAIGTMPTKDVSFVPIPEKVKQWMDEAKNLVPRTFTLKAKKRKVPDSDESAERSDLCVTSNVQKRAEQGATEDMVEAKQLLVDIQNYS